VGRTEYGLAASHALEGVLCALIVAEHATHPWC
jgi:hypothetical protein